MAPHVAVGMRHQQLRVGPRFEQLRQHFHQPRRRRHAQAARAEPVAQQVVAAVRAQRAQFRQLDAVAIEARRQILHSQFRQQALRRLRMLGAAGKAFLETGKRLRQHGHHLVPQGIAGKAGIVVRFVVDVRDRMARHVRFQLFARHGQQRARHYQVRIAQQLGRAVGAIHAGQARRAGTAQQLQQHRFSLVILVVGREQQAHAVRGAQLAQGRVTALAGRLFRARLRILFHGDLARFKGDAHAGAQLLAVRQPRIRVRTQAVVHVERMQGHAMLLRPGMRQVQQGRGIEAAAEGDAYRPAGLRFAGFQRAGEDVGHGGDLLLFQCGLRECKEGQAAKRMMSFSGLSLEILIHCRRKSGVRPDGTRRPRLTPAFCCVANNAYSLGVVSLNLP